MKLRRWVRLAVAWLLVLLAIAFFATGDAAGIIFGLTVLAVAYVLFGCPGWVARNLKAWRPSTGAVSIKRTAQGAVAAGPPIQLMTYPERRITSKSPSPQAMNRLNSLPTAVRIAIVNGLEPEEEPAFVVLGANQVVVIGTNRRLLVVPEGRNAANRIWASPYGALVSAQLEQHKHGARLYISTVQAPSPTPIVRLDGEAQVQSGIDAIQQIRSRIALARQQAAEPVSPPEQSAFSETSHRGIPSGGRSASLTLGDMLEMNPTAFEEFTGKALEALGYKNVVRIGGSGDLGADLTATDPQGRSAIVQCKRYTPGSSVGSPILQAFIGMKTVHHRAERGIFVTTADYSQQAIDLAKQHDIVLIDGDDLVKIAALVLTPQAQIPASLASSIFSFCPECGTKLRERSKFCPSCGTALASP